MASLRFVCALGLLAAACTGQIASRGSEPDQGEPAPGAGGRATGSNGGGGRLAGGDGGGGGASMPPVDPGPTPPGQPQPGRMRLLTRAQLENSLRDLLGPVVLGETPPDNLEQLPSVGATYDELTDSAVEMYQGAFKTMLGALFADAAKRQALLSDCAPAAPGDQACVRKFVAGFGQRAWRRPLTSAEVDRYTMLALGAATRAGDPWAGLLDTTRSLLGSPNFLYRVELGAPDPAMGGRYRYGGYEMASRLSYFLTGSTPDAALLAAAAAGRLDTSDGIRAEVTRILGTDRGKQGFATFAREFFTLDEFMRRPTDDPRYTATLRRAMADEVQALYAGVVAPGVDAFELFDTTKAFVTDELARIYGIPGITSKTLVPATLPASIPRVGILGRGPFLAGSSAEKAGAVAPILRGLFIAEDVLCRPIPAPPPGVPPLPATGPTQTTRDALEQHRKDPGCATCHAMFDPLGLVFETFDAVGEYRAKDPSGKDIITSGQLDDVPFKDSKELAGMLRASPDAASCFTTALFRYAVGHPGTKDDLPTQRRWEQDFPRLGRDLTKVFTEMMVSDAFHYVSVAPPRAPADAKPGKPMPGMTPDPTTPPPDPTTTPGTGTPPPGNLAQMCAAYCNCMGSGRCSSRNPASCVATCMRDGAKWDIACRTDKCKIAQNDYADQIEGDCSAAVGINACWNSP